MCVPCGEDSEQVDAGIEQKASAQQPARDQGQPAQAMIDEHELSHSPFRSLCEACVRVRAIDSPSRKVKGLLADHVLLRVRMDYCFLTEEADKKSGEHGEEESERVGASMTVLVL